MATTTTTITLRLKEYDVVDGVSECVQWGDYEAKKLRTLERTVRSFLASGDYSEGGAERRVEVYVGDRLHDSYTAPQIRRFRV